MKLTVKGINTAEVLDINLFELTVIPRFKQAFEPFKVSSYMKEGLNVGADVIHIKTLQEKKNAPSSSRPSYILLWKRGDDTGTGLEYFAANEN